MGSVQCSLLTVSRWACGFSAVFSVHSFTVGVWVQLSPAGVTGKQPIICLLSSLLCFYINESRLGGQVGQHSVEGSTVLNSNTWYHVAVRYEAESTFILNLGCEHFCYLYLICLKIYPKILA